MTVQTVGTPVDVVTFGETMGSIRSHGLLRMGGNMNLSLAGAESNVAIGLARLGHRARWTGRVGDDELGQLALRTLRAEGVSVENVVIDSQRPTGLMLLEHRVAGISRVAYYRTGSAGSALCRDDLGSSIQEARVLHISGITPALSASAAEATVWAVSEARSRGVLVSLDLNYRAKLWSRTEAKPVLRELARLSAVVIASEDELNLAAADGATEADAVAELMSIGVEQVVVKRGALGATAWQGEEQLTAAAKPVTVVDTIGAGDAFTAGYLSGLLDGLSLAARADRGVAMGAFAVSGSGDWEGLPTRSELALLEAESGSTIR